MKHKMFTTEECVGEGEVCPMEGSSALWSNRQLPVGNAGAVSM